MNRLTLAITALVSLCGTQLVAVYTIKNNAPVSAEIYLVGQRWSYMSQKSDPKGNLAYDDQGSVDKQGKFRTIAPGKSTEYSWEEGDMRNALPLDKVMVKFAGETDFSKATPDNKVAPGSDQTIILTKTDDKAHISYEGGEPLGTPGSTAETASVANIAEIMKERRAGIKPAKKERTLPTPTPSE